MQEILVVQPDASCPLSEFEDWFENAGVVADTVRPYLGDQVPTQVDQAGLVVLGGDMSSLDDADYPWLEDIRQLMRRTAEDNVPILGICLGAQLMAQAFGGATGVGEAGLEAGVARINWRTEAQADPLFHDLPQPFLAGSMHRDSITELPAGTTHLGDSSPYPNQAFRVGAMAWGVQFHPEIAYDRYKEWADMLSESTPADAERLHAGGAEFKSVESDVLAGTQIIAERFASVVRQRVEAG